MRERTIRLVRIWSQLVTTTSNCNVVGREKDKAETAPKGCPANHLHTGSA